MTSVVPMFDFSFFNIFTLLVKLVFAVILSIILVTAIKGLIQWKKNNDSPVETVRARVVTKRGDTTHHTQMNGNMPISSSSTRYYATFEFDGGERREFHLRGRDYGLLAEGDAGALSFRGTRYLGFERDV
ncbi:MAG: DUF2500 domain-containing protein [Oscillospiraceae bacterium]|nr:DUF2500 domain-containing protein [Oscillospiraceae bacterium]